MERFQGHSDRAQQLSGRGTAGVTAAVSYNITAQTTSSRGETWAGSAGKARDLTSTVPHPIPAVHPGWERKACHRGLVMQWAGSWGLWGLLAAGPALVGTMLPPLHTKHPLCSQAGAKTAWLLASSSGPKPHSDGATACKCLCPRFLFLGPIRAGKEERKMGSPFLSPAACTGKVAMAGLWLSMLHNDLAMLPIIPLSCRGPRDSTTLTSTWPAPCHSAMLLT